MSLLGGPIGSTGGQDHSVQDHSVQDHSVQDHSVQDHSVTAGYSGTPLPRKLGVRPDSRVLVLGAPDGFDPGAPFHRRPGRAPYDVVLLFCPDVATMHRRFAAAAAKHTSAGTIWVCWPKRSSGVPTDLDENVVREYGLAHGRVDVKVAAIDATWSGLKFVVRLRDR